jgi:hypothetical protein
MEDRQRGSFKARVRTEVYLVKKEAHVSSPVMLLLLPYAHYCISLMSYIVPYFFTIYAPVVRPLLLVDWVLKPLTGKFSVLEELHNGNYLTPYAHPT